MIKLSKLAKAGKVWRGTCYGLLPSEFWVEDQFGVLGGIEFGFQSTTRDRSQAVHYATGGGYAKAGDAMTLFEINMGMVDRGAELGWFSQYPHGASAPAAPAAPAARTSLPRLPPSAPHPHDLQSCPTWRGPSLTALLIRALRRALWLPEREVLLPPLTGIEPTQTAVDGDMLEIHSRLSLNLAAQTLEQVLSRRRKMLLDMADGIEIDLKRMPPDVLKPDLVQPAIKMLRASLDYGALCYPPEWFNDDDNFSLVLNMTLYLQRVLVRDIERLYAALQKPVLDLRGWKPLGPSRIMMLAGWIGCRPVVKAASRRADDAGEKVKEVLIDLRDATLSETDGIALANLLQRQKHIAVDVRGNESLGEAGSNALVSFMLENYSRADRPRRTVCGVCNVRSDSLTLVVPSAGLAPIELRLIAAELVSGIFAEGITGSMGGKNTSLALNRVSTAFRVDWLPLVWAGKNNHMQLAETMLTFINQQEAAAAHGLKVDANKAEVHGEQKTAAHWTAATGHVEMLRLLISHGANLEAVDKHNNTVLAVAQKKRQNAVVTFLSNHLGVAVEADTRATPRTAGGARAPARRGAGVISK